MLQTIKRRMKRLIKEKLSLAVGRAHFDANRPALFNTVELELRKKCNGTCSFCAAAAQFDTRPDVSMPEDIFQKIIDELGGLKYTGRLCFFINTEPLLDKRLPRWVAMARRVCSNASLHVMTNGKSLTHDLGRLLLENGLDILEINNYSDTDTVFPNIRSFMDVVAPDFPGRVRLNRRKLTAQLNNRAGSSPNGSVLSRPLKSFCQRPFEKIMISAEGVVGLCEHDFYFSERIGSVRAQSLKDIWFCDRFREIRRRLLAGDRAAIPLCAKCDYSGFRRIVNPHESYRGPTHGGRTLKTRFLTSLNRFANAIDTPL
ncbi:SPASM domain-containing protein [bacterium]|nr:SPASM domain-containing protein [bacterium]